MLYKTFGLLNSFTTLEYFRTGLMVTVAEIPNIVAGTMSNKIMVTIERSVPYEIVLYPKSDISNITFHPDKLVFVNIKGPFAEFTIQPDRSLPAS